MPLRYGTNVTMLHSGLHCDSDEVVNNNVKCHDKKLNQIDYSTFNTLTVQNELLSVHVVVEFRFRIVQFLFESLDHVLIATRFRRQFVFGLCHAF